MTETTTKPYTVVIHRPTGRQFALGRNYELLGDDTAHDVANHVDKWDAWTPLKTYGPEWVKNHQVEEFTAYWLY